MNIIVDVIQSLLLVVVSAANAVIAYSIFKIQRTEIHRSSTCNGSLSKTKTKNAQFCL